MSIALVKPLFLTSGLRSIEIEKTVAAFLSLYTNSVCTFWILSTFALKFPWQYLAVASHKHKKLQRKRNCDQRHQKSFSGRVENQKDLLID